MHTAIKNALLLAKNRRKYQTGGSTPYGVVDLGDKIILGSPHGDKIELPEDIQSRVRDVAQKHGAYYEGTGGDIESNKELLPEYRGSWDEQYARNISGYPTEYLAPMFSNVEVNRPHEIFEDPKKTIMASILANQAKARYIKDRDFNEKVLRDFLLEGSEPDTNFLKLSQEPATKENLLKFFTTGEKLMWPDNWQEYPHNLGKIAKRFEDARNSYLLNAPPGVYVAGAGHIPELKRLKKDLNVIGGERSGYGIGGTPTDDQQDFTGSVELGRPDEVSQEAFLQEQLQGSAPQYDPEAGMLTAKRAGLMAAGFAPGSGIATAAGQFPTAEGGKEPSMAEDWRKGEYLSAGLKGLGAAGDIAYGVPLVGPAVGAAMKAPLVAKLAMAAAPMAKIAGEVAPAVETVSRVTNPIGMYSAAAEAARALPQEKGTLQQMLATMKGVTPEELHWSGVSEAFAGKPTVTREELAKHFEERLPGVSETVLVDEPIKGSGWESVEGGTKFGEHTLPGGENYREVVLHLPEISPEAQKLEARRREIEALGREATEEQKTEWANIMNRLQPEQRDIEGLDQFKGFPTFQSQHWNQPNVLSHLRMSDRTGPDGEKVLHLEELQSDWGQKGRKEGFRDQESFDKANRRVKEIQEKEKELNNKLNDINKNMMIDEDAFETMLSSNPDPVLVKKFYQQNQNILDASKPIDKELENLQNERLSLVSDMENFARGVPSAPYVASPEGKHTLSWVDLGLKRALKEAAEGGYDKLIWTPGPEQAARYDLSKQIQRIEYDPKFQMLNAYKPNGFNAIEKSNVKPEQLSEYIGKEAAEKLLQSQPDSWGIYKLADEDLKVGGEGMKSFYDKIVPNQLQKIVKKLDKDAKVQIGGHAIETDDGAINAHVIQITPKMREAILKGFAAYADGGAVKPKQRNSAHLGPIIERGMKITQKLSAKKGQKPSTTIPKPVKYVPQAKENAEFRKLMAEVDELLEKFKD